MCHRYFFVDCNAWSGLDMWLAAIVLECKISNIPNKKDDLFRNHFWNIIFLNLDISDEITWKQNASLNIRIIFNRLEYSPLKYDAGISLVFRVLRMHDGLAKTKSHLLEVTLLTEFFFPKILLLSIWFVPLFIF